MQVVNSTEFATHHQKYFNLALHEQLLVRNGNDMFRVLYEPAAVEEQVVLQPDENLRRAITGEELLAGIYEDLETFFASKQ